MNPFFSFVAGFVAGWLARSSAASSRTAAVDIASFGLDLLERLKRAATLERERLEDLLAEMRSRADEWRAERSAARDRSASGVNGGGPAVAGAGSTP